MNLSRMLLAAALAVPSVISPAHSSSPVPASGTHAKASGDFAWEFGSWRTTVRVRLNPLSSGPADWASYEGQSVIRPLLDGRANFVELSVAGPRGKIEGGSLRLFDPQTGQWSLNYANLRDGRLTAPVYGAFNAEGRGIFTGQDFVDGRAIIVRFVITRLSDREAHFEQSYSADGGVTWEKNWDAVDTMR